jgi:hypothetical protein
LDGLGVEVHAVEVVREDLAVEIEEGALAAQFLEPGVGESDVQAGIAFVYGAEQAAEVEPDGFWVVRVAVLEGMLGHRVEERFGFKGHLPGDRVGGSGEKPRGFRLKRSAGKTSNIQHPTSNLERSKWDPNLELRTLNLEWRGEKPTPEPLAAC